MTRLSLNIMLIGVLALSGFSASAQAPDPNLVAAALESLRMSVNEHDYAQLEPNLGAEFSYQGRDTAMSKMIMRQVVNGYPNEITAINILSTSPASNTWEIAVRMESPGQSDNRTITLNSNYKIVRADIADIQLAGHGGQPAQAAPQSNDNLPAATTVPFELAERIIVVQAEINGVAGNYLVDTGAQATMLNSSRFDAANLETFALNHALPKGAGGTIQDVRATKDLELKWGAIQIQGLRGLVADLSHLEKNLGGIPVMGLIGYNVLEQFQLYFDYAAQQLTLFSLDNTDQSISDTGLGEPELTLLFDMMGHIPVLPVRIAGQDMKMGLDSGAAGAMLFTKWQKPLKGKYEFIERTELTGGDTNVQMGDVVRIDSMQIANIAYPDMTFRFNDLAAHGDRPMPLDGLLGYQFLQSQPVAINFRSRQLILWPRNSLACVKFPTRLAHGSICPGPSSVL
jgi:predicted aspartyl protease